MNNYSSDYTQTVLNLSPAEYARLAARSEEISKEIDISPDELNKQMSQFIERASQLETDTCSSQKKREELFLHLRDELESLVKEHLTQLETELETELETDTCPSQKKREELFLHLRDNFVSFIKEFNRLVAQIEELEEEITQIKREKSYHINEDGKIIITEPKILEALDPISQRIVKSLQAIGDIIVQEVS